MIGSLMRGNGFSMANRSATARHGLNLKTTQYLVRFRFALHSYLNVTSDTYLVLEVVSTQGRTL